MAGPQRAPTFQALPLSVSNAVMDIPDVSEPANDWQVEDGISAESLVSAITDFVQNDPEFQPSLDEILRFPSDEYGFQLQAALNEAGERDQLYQLELASELFAPDVAPPAPAQPDLQEEEDYGDDVDLNQFD